mmetsp:Transcript_112984/g.319587  ORF Transcript_112984/g.319587 Transcript_112984/m.319587 type:complete len:494 (-) Transcript_112984:32-1513(-)
MAAVRAVVPPRLCRPFLEVQQPRRSTQARASPRCWRGAATARRATGAAWTTVPQAAAGGLASAIAATAAALWAAKAIDPPEDGDAAAWCRRRTFGAGPDSGAAAAENAVLEALASHGLSAQEFGASARASWNGVELCAETAAARASTDGGCPSDLATAVEGWREAGMLEAKGGRALEPETRRTYGVDVGSAAPLYIGRPADAPRLTDDALAGVLKALRVDGAAIVSGAARANDLRRLRQLFRVLGGGGPFACPQEVSTADVLAAASGAAAPLQPTVGRRHFLIRGTRIAEEDVAPLLSSLMPVVYRYFSEWRPDAPPGSVLVAPSKGQLRPKIRPPRMFLSECQLLVSDPGAVAQMWHRDNRRPGLTVLLPLTDVDDEVGPTHLLPGSHRLGTGGGGGFAALVSALGALRRGPGAIAAAPLRAGDALIYDARLLHRGLGNSSYGRCRVVVVMRLDFDDSPPPGATIAQTTASRVTGMALCAVGALHAILPVRS